MDDSDALMGIGVFARQVGLTPSALRFYDDCGVLRPAQVDEASGYRFYAPEQEARAVLLRRLRGAGMPLTDVVVVLDGAAEEARAVLRAHGRKVRESAASAGVAVEEVLRGLGVEGRGRAVVGGAELASAARQVVPSVATGETAAEIPVLGCVLVELDRQEVRLVATDRYRLAVRALPASVESAPRRLLVRAADLVAAASWALPRQEVAIETDGDGARLRDGDAAHPLPTVEGVFPDYQLILDDLPRALHRVITDRASLAAALTAAGDDGPVVLHAAHHLTLSHGGTTTAPVSAVHSGPPVRIAFNPTVLLPALDAGVGPDVLLDIASPTQPVIVRSADQGSFTTLVMPVRDPASDDPSANP